MKVSMQRLIFPVQMEGRVRCFMLALDSCTKRLALTSVKNRVA